MIISSSLEAKKNCYMTVYIEIGKICRPVLEYISINNIIELFDEDFRRIHRILQYLRQLEHFAMRATWTDLIFMVIKWPIHDDCLWKYTKVYQALYNLKINVFVVLKLFKFWLFKSVCKVETAFRFPLNLMGNFFAIGKICRGLF